MMGYADRLSALEKIVAKQEAVVKTLTELPKETRPNAIVVRLTTELAATHREISDARQRLTAMEAAVLSDPAKALSLPLLRRDLDNLKDSAKENLVAVRDEMGRLYDLSKWFIGLMITMAIGVLTLALQGFLTRAKSP
jgi:uncharacterized coiled-coil protein SlyX